MTLRRGLLRAAGAGGVAGPVFLDTFTAADTTPVTSRAPDIGSYVAGWSFYGASYPRVAVPNQQIFGNAMARQDAVSADGPIVDAGSAATTTEILWKTPAAVTRIGSLGFRQELVDGVRNGYLFELRTNLHVVLSQLPAFTTLFTGAAPVNGDLFKIEDNGVDEIRLYKNGGLIHTELSAVAQAGKTHIGWYCATDAQDYGFDTVQITA